MMKCKNCGTEIGEGVKFCPECGRNIVDTQEESIENAVHVVEETKRCVECGKELKAEAKFCPNCGSSVDDKQEKVIENIIPVEVKKCVNCEAELKAEAKFCPNCGSSVLDAQEKAIENIAFIEEKNFASCEDASKEKLKAGNTVSDVQEKSIENVVSAVKEVKRCVKCGKELKAEAKFCPNCGSSAADTQEKANTSRSNQEEIYTEEENKKGVFYFEKVKMIGRVRHTIIKTEVRSDGYKLDIKQNIHKFLRRDKNSTLTIALSEISAIEIRTKMDFWDTLYAAIFGVIFILDVTDVVWLLFIALFLYAAYGKIIDLKMKNKSNFEIPVDGMTEDVESFLKLHNFAR